MERPFADKRPIGPIAQSSSRGGSSEDVFVEFRVDTDSIWGPLEDAAANDLEARKMREEDVTYISDVGTTYLVDVVERQMGGDGSEVAAAMTDPVYTAFDREPFEHKGSQTSIIIALFELSSEDLAMVREQMEMDGIEIISSEFTSI